VGWNTTEKVDSWYGTVKDAVWYYVAPCSILVGLVAWLLSLRPGFIDALMPDMHDGPEFALT
jgi:hypothetical protein